MERYGGTATRAGGAGTAEGKVDPLAGTWRRRDCQPLSADARAALMPIKPGREDLRIIATMLARTIPIRPIPVLSGRGAPEPLLAGESTRLRELLAGLDRLASDEFGAGLPRSAWLRELRIEGGEAVLSLAPSFRRQGADFAQAAFDLLRRELLDTDIYVRAAAH